MFDLLLGLKPPHENAKGRKISPSTRRRAAPVKRVGADLNAAFDLLALQPLTPYDLGVELGITKVQAQGLIDQLINQGKARPSGSIRSINGRTVELFRACSLVAEPSGHV